MIPILLIIASALVGLYVDPWGWAGVLAGLFLLSQWNTARAGGYKLRFESILLLLLLAFFGLMVAAEFSPVAETIVRQGGGAVIDALDSANNALDKMR
jgi:hypothetical protein